MTHARHYGTKRRAELNWFLHGIVPAAGAVLFFLLYYEYVKVPPTYPIKYANWVAYPDRLAPQTAPAGAPV